MTIEMTTQYAAEIRYRDKLLHEWLGKRTSWKPEEVPEWIRPPSNEERGAVELFEFKRDRPERYFLYIDTLRRIATTWMGDKLGDIVEMGAPWRDNFGGERVSVRINAITGDVYSGTYHKSSGSYARVKKLKNCAWKLSHE